MGPWQRRGMLRLVFAAMLLGLQLALADDNSFLTAEGAGSSDSDPMQAGTPSLTSTSQGIRGEFKANHRRSSDEQLLMRLGPQTSRHLLQTFECQGHNDCLNNVYGYGSKGSYCTSAFTCACQVDSNCQHQYAAGPFCRGVCVACMDTSDCEGSLVCNTTTNVCQSEDEDDPASSSTCDFDDQASVHPTANNATCPKDFVTDASFVVTLQGPCSTTMLDLRELATDVLIEFLPFVPACAMEISLLGTARRRQLLQAGPATYVILFRVYADDAAQGERVSSVFNSYALGAFIRDTLKVNVAAAVSVLDVQTSVQRVAGATSDPHFVTLSGDKFDFNGVAGSTYCIVTDERLQVNARFVGASAAKLPFSSSAQGDARTWMDQVAVMHGGDRVLIDAASPLGASYASSVGSVIVNGSYAHVRLVAPLSSTGV
eukprot:jgi/Mesvir1/25621/Mv01845-RA.2